MIGGLALFAIASATLLFSRAILRTAGEQRLSIAGALTAAILFAGTSLLARVTGNLVIAAAIVGLASLGAAFALRRRPRLHPAPEDEDDLPVPAVYLAIGALALLLVSWAAVRGYWWDEHSGHFALTSVIARGIVPPEHPLFPGEAFRYHYGFDVLAALVRAFSGADAARSIDVATVACFVLLLLVARDAGRALAGRHGAGLALVLAPLGSAALQFLLFKDAGPLEVRWSAIPMRWADSMPPPVISNFFQHPQGLGIPLALATVLLFTGAEPSSPFRRRRAILGAILLGALSLAQVVFFLVLGLALGTAVCLDAIRRKHPLVLLELLFLAGALALARLLGGFFEPGPTPGHILRFGASFFGGTTLETVLWHLVLFGLPLVALPFSIVKAVLRPSALRAALITAALIGFLVPAFVAYERSWDVVKFYGVGGFFANVLLADLLAPLARGGLPRRALLGSLVLASTFTSWFFLLRMSALDGRLGVPPMHFPPPSEIGRRTGERLEPLMEPRDYVFSTNVDVGTAAGLLTPGFSWRALGEGLLIDRGRADRLWDHKRKARLHLGATDLAALGVRWAVFSPGDLEALSPEGHRALEDRSRFEHVFDVEAGGEKKHIYRVLY